VPHPHYFHLLFLFSGKNVTFRGGLGELESPVYDLTGQHPGETNHIHLLPHLLRLRLQLLLDVEVFVVHLVVVLQVMCLGELLVARAASDVTNIIISLLMSPLLGHRPSLWFTNKKNGP
jgi:hypothetical protein